MVSCLFTGHNAPGLTLGANEVDLSHFLVKWDNNN